MVGLPVIGLICKLMVKPVDARHHYQEPEPTPTPKPSQELAMA